MARAFKATPLGDVPSPSCRPAQWKALEPDRVPRRVVGGPDLGLVESKLRPTRSRPGDVVRATLLDRLEASVAPIISVVAPAGYGKSTLLGQWVDRCPLPSTWLSLDRYDNDPGVLLGHLIAALERIEPIDPEHRASLLAEAAVDSSWSLRRLAVLVSSMQTPFLSCSTMWRR